MKRNEIEELKEFDFVKVVNGFNVKYGRIDKDGTAHCDFVKGFGANNSFWADVDLDNCAKHLYKVTDEDELANVIGDFENNDKACVMDCALSLGAPNNDFGVVVKFLEEVRYNTREKSSDEKRKIIWKLIDEAMPEYRNNLKNIKENECREMAEELMATADRMMKMFK